MRVVLSTLLVIIIIFPAILLLWKEFRPKPPKSQMRGRDALREKLGTFRPVGQKKIISATDFMGDKDFRCRITCTDRLTGEVTNYPWYKLKDEGYLEEWVESLKAAPMADNPDYMVLPPASGTKALSDRYDYKIEYE